MHCSIPITYPDGVCKVATAAILIQTRGVQSVFSLENEIILLPYFLYFNMHNLKFGLFFQVRLESLEALYKRSPNSRTCGHILLRLVDSLLHKMFPVPYPVDFRIVLMSYYDRYATELRLRQKDQFNLSLTLEFFFNFFGLS